MAYLLSLNATELEDAASPHLQPRQLSDTDEELAASVTRLFQLVAQDDVEQVRFLVAPQEKQSSGDATTLANGNENCHPLCDCERCIERERVIGSARKRKLTVKSRDERHWTCKLI